MRKMEEAKRQYEEIPIPEELEERVLAAIGQAEETRENRGPSRIARRRIRSVRSGAMAAAAAAVVFVTALNTNMAFAEGMKELPVIGAVARVLTFRSYEKEGEGWKISVEVPGIETVSADLEGVSGSVNQEIARLCQEYADEAEKRAEDYRKAFLDTGGTEEEWEAHKIEIKVWYEVLAQTESYLSLAVKGSESWSSAYHQSRYYNFDLRTGELVTLKGLLGDSVLEAEDAVRRELERREQEEGLTVWSPEEGGFNGFDENTQFYINESGNPVIVFEKYQIGPGSIGEPEVEIAL